jgi:hypothetical protein
MAPNGAHQESSVWQQLQLPGPGCLTFAAPRTQLWEIPSPQELEWSGWQRQCHSFPLASLLVFQVRRACRIAAPAVYRSLQRGRGTNTLRERWWRPSQAAHVLEEAVFPPPDTKDPYNRSAGREEVDLEKNASAYIHHTNKLYIKAAIFSYWKH